MRDSLRAWEISGGKEAIDKSKNTKREIYRKKSLRMNKHVVAREIEMNLRKLEHKKNESWKECACVRKRARIDKVQTKRKRERMQGRGGQKIQR